MNEENNVPTFLKKSPEEKPVAPTSDPLENVSLEPLSTEPKKKSHKLRTFFLILLCLGLIAGGVFYFFFFVYNNPENVALGAVKNLLTAENVALDGKITVLDTAIEENGDSPRFPFENVRSVSLTLDSSSNPASLAGVSTLTLTVEPRSDALDLFEFNIGSVLSKNGKFYLYLNGLADAFSELVESNLEEKGLNFEDLESPEDYEDVISVNEFFYLSEIIEALKTLDETWVEVSVDDLVEIAGDFFRLNSTEKSKITELISCVGNVAGNLRTRLTEISDLYETLKFIELGKQSKNSSQKPETLDLTSDYYYLTFSPETLTKFLKEVRNSRVGKDLWNCKTKFARETELEILADSEDDADFDENEVTEIIEKYNNNFHTYVEVDKTHTLKKFSATNSTVALNSRGEIPYITIDLGFSYPTSVEVKTPTEYVPLSDLISTLKANLSEESVVESDE